MYLLNSILFSLVILINTEEDKNGFLKFKSDVHDIGKGFENLIFDIVTKIVDDVTANQDNYSTEEDISPQETTTQHSVAKKILDDFLENSAQNNSAENNFVHFTISENSTYHENRLKRSVDGNSSTALNEEKKLRTDPLVINEVKETCPNNSLSEGLGLQHIEELKEEIQKLHDLVILLRDQQRILSLLDQNFKSSDSDISSKFNSEDMLKILDYVNNRNIQEQKMKSSMSDKKSDEINEKRKNMYEELLTIKKDVKETIATLNRTKDILIMERKQELLLEKELVDQKLDLSFLRMMVEWLFKHSHNKNSPSDSARDDILKLPQYQLKKQPDRNMAEKIVEERNSKSKDDKQEDITVSDLEHLERLLHKINSARRTAGKNEILDLGKKSSETRRGEDIVKQLSFLEKLLPRDNRQNDDSSPGESEIRKDPLPKKITNGKIETELEKLQQAINNLRSKDQVEELPLSGEEDLNKFRKILRKIIDHQKRNEEDESGRFQMMLKKILNKDERAEENPLKQFQIMLKKITNQSGKVYINSSDGKEQNLLLKDINELRKLLTSVDKQNLNDVYGNAPNEADRFGMFHQNYPPHMNTGYPTINNVNTNQQPPNYIIPPDHSNANTPSVIPSYQLIPQIYQKSLDGDLYQNDFQSSSVNNPFKYPNQYNIGYNEQNPYNPFFGSARQSNRLGTEHFNQNQYSDNHLNDLDTAMPPYKYNPRTKTDVNILKLNEIPFEFTIFPDNNNFDGETYQKQLMLEPIINPHDKPPIPYSRPNPNSQGVSQHNANQFVRASQPTDYTNPVAGSSFSPNIHSGSSQSEAYPSETKEDLERIYRRVDELKVQIYNLQSMIETLKERNYTQAPQDREVLLSLENQIHELNDIVSSQNPNLNAPTYMFNKESQHLENAAGYPDKLRRKRSLADSKADDSQLYDQVASGLKQLIFERGNKIEEKINYDDIQSKINDLKLQLENKVNSSNGQSDPILQSAVHEPPYYQPSHFSYAPAKIPPYHLVKPKETDAFTSLVVKIFEKILRATPAVLGTLFGDGITELSNFRDYPPYEDGNGVYLGNQRDIQKLFNSLGFFGYGPFIILRLIDGFTTFFQILRKNASFKNFSMPALILLLVAGSVVFLIWWLQPDADIDAPNPRFQAIGNYYDNYNKRNEPYSNYNYQSNGYGNNNNNYGYGASYSLPVYSRSYFQNDIPGSNYL